MYRFVIACFRRLFKKGRTKERDRLSTRSLFFKTNFSFRNEVVEIRKKNIKLQINYLSIVFRMYPIETPYNLLSR